MTDKLNAALGEVNLAKLGIKIELISTEIGALKEDEKNQHSNYSYISYQQMDAKLRTLLSKHKLSIIPEITSQKEEVYTVKEKQVIRTSVEGSFLIIDLDTGFSMTRHWVGTDQDYGGKSAGQSITEFCKRFYFKLFKVSSKEDLDPDSKTTEIKGAKEQKPAERKPALKPHPASREGLLASLTDLCIKCKCKTVADVQGLTGYDKVDDPSIPLKDLEALKKELELKLEADNKTKGESRQIKEEDIE